ncbi:alpha/beta hydrolase [Streptomyces pratensis]|jgi:acetyl esterase/lipase|uniref:alpha/beta hydrolase n=1 Tax=Streptomyces pratensis TaxID=1169025 RepID=UPI00362F1ABB
MEQQCQPLEPPIVLERLARAFAEGYRCPDGGDGAGAAGARAAAAPWQDDSAGHPDVTEEWLALPGPGGQRIRVCVLRPAGAAGPLPVVLYLHGIGWTLGSATAHRRLIDDLVLGVDAAVVVPEYDRVPEARYPVAVEQGHTVAGWIADHGSQWQLDAGRMAVAGVSAGANLAAGVTLLAHRSGAARFRHQVLVCPVTDAAMDTPSYERFAEGYFLSRSTMKGFWQAYVPDPARRSESAASPLRAGASELAGLPPALVVTAEADVVRDEGEAYAARLREAGVPVVSVRYHGTVHGFVLFGALRESDASRAARTQMTDTLHVALHSGCS